MYVNIGGDMAVRDRAIIGIFDLDGASLSKKTMEYLESVQEDCVRHVPQGVKTLSATLR